MDLGSNEGQLFITFITLRLTKFFKLRKSATRRIAFSSETK